MLGDKWNENIQQSSKPRAVPTTAPLFWATADIIDAFGSVLHKKLTRIVTGTAKDLICYPDARRLANEVCYRVVRHVVSFRIGGKIRCRLVF